MKTKEGQIQNSTAIFDDDEQPTDEVEQTGGSGLTEDDVNILDYIPERLKDRARKLLKLLQRSKRLKWDGAGNVSFDGKEIKFSNISDLIFVSLRPTPSKNYNYPGVHQYVIALRELNVPQSLLSPYFRNVVFNNAKISTKSEPDYKWIRFNNRYKMKKR